VSGIGATAWVICETVEPTGAVGPEGGGMMPAIGATAWVSCETALPTMGTTGVGPKGPRIVGPEGPSGDGPEGPGGMAPVIGATA
jgi:hypothetical protein